MMLWMTKADTALAQKIPAAAFNMTVKSGIQKEIAEYYRLADSQCLWIRSGQIPVLMQHLQQSSRLGFGRLFEPTSDRPLIRAEDSISRDLQLTETALKYLSAMKCGSAHPAFGYEGLDYDCPIQGLGRMLWEALRAGNLKSAFYRLMPSAPEYAEATALLGKLQDKVESADFSDISIRQLKNVSDSQLLCKRLSQLSLIPEGMIITDSGKLREIILKTQVMFDLEADGKVGRKTIQAINVPLSERIQSLEKMLDFMRWSEGLRKAGMNIFLNIPAARLTAYQNGSRVLESKVIVGKASTPTPTLTSVFEEVILYPFWMVPYKIATKELLPDIKRDIGYLERGNYQVLNRQGKVMDPYRINWQALSPYYFPYVIRQATGCDNALGTVKFEFKNPFTVYLHDTPGKDLFNRKKRFYSHGCMRVEKPVDLAHLLLGSNRMAIDTITEKGCLLQQKPIPVAAENKAGLIVHYNTAWYDYQAGIIFYDDIYGRLKRSRQ